MKSNSVEIRQWKPKNSKNTGKKEKNQKKENNQKIARGKVDTNP
nr:hypothetical protein [Mycoplasmopsis bovis]